MRLLMFVIFSTPLFLFAQTQEKLETIAEKKSQDRLNQKSHPYNHISFGKMKEIRSLSQTGSEQIDSLINLKYEYFLVMSDQLDDSNRTDYRTTLNEYDKQIKSTRKNASEITGYQIDHHFTSKTDEGFKVYYSASYLFSKELEILESKIKRRVDRANTDH